MPLTILIPVWNEEGPLRDVIAEILSLPELADTRILIIDDGSTDRTPQIAEALARDNARVAVLQRPHAGKDHALWAGIAGAQTEWLGMTDGDGQYDPRDFARLLDAANERRADAVWGVRARRQDTAFRLAISRAGRWFKRQMLGGSAVTDSGCGIWVARRSFLLPIIESCPNPSGQVHCHLADLMAAQGAVVVEQSITHRSRSQGQAKYGMFNRLGPGFRSLVQASAIRRALRKAA